MILGAVNKTTWRLFYSAFRYCARHRPLRLWAPGRYWALACRASGASCCDAHMLGHSGPEHGTLGGELFREIA